jgi:hypothetical protein
VRAALGEQGVRDMTFSFDHHGAQVLVNDPFIDNDEHSGGRWTFVAYSS